MFFDKLEQSNEHFTVKDYAFLISSLSLLTFVAMFFNIKEFVAVGAGLGPIIGFSFALVMFVPLYWYVCTNVLCFLTDALISFINRFRHRKEGNK